MIPDQLDLKRYHVGDLRQGLLLKSVFIADSKAGVPRPGDLIRNRMTGNYINLVLSVSEARDGETAIRSVRFAKTNGDKCQYLTGTRSRSILYNNHLNSDWEVVYEFRAFDNRSRRVFNMHQLHGVETAYKTPSGDNDGDD